MFVHRFLKHIGSKQFLILLLAYIGISLLNTAHFYFYYHQPLLRSLDWSFSIWAIWFVLLLILHPIIRPFVPQKSPNNYIALFAIALVIGFLHIFISITIDFITDTNTRPFWVDFWRQYNKRWHTNLIIFAVFWLALEYRQLKQTVNVSLTKKQGETVTIEDGKKVYKLNPADIQLVSSQGNYVEIQLPNEKKLVRNTLKQIEQLLDQQGFIRISRSCIANKKMLIAYDFANSKKLQVQLSDGQVLKVSKNYKQALEEHFS